MPPLPRIHVTGPLTAGQDYELPQAAVRHVVQVLRLRNGDALTLFDGSGGEYPATLADVGRRGARARLEAHHAVERESPLGITLLQGVSKGERMDYTVQKAAELGVSRIVPVISRYCSVRLEGERWDRKLAHWRSVAASACEQCGRTRLPDITEPLDIDRLLASPDPDSCALVLEPDAATGFGGVPQAARYRLLIGPEGGLAEDEVRRAQSAGFLGVRLGPRILRTETAGPVAAALLQARFGDLG